MSLQLRKFRDIRNLKLADIDVLSVDEIIKLLDGCDIDVLIDSAVDENTKRVIMKYLRIKLIGKE